MLWGAEEVLRTSISTFQRVRRTRSPSGCWSRRRGRCGRCVCLQTGAASCAWLIRLLASDSVAPSHSPPAPYAPLLPCVRTHSRARAHTHTHTHTHTRFSCTVHRVAAETARSTPPVLSCDMTWCLISYGTQMTRCGTQTKARDNDASAPRVSYATTHVSHTLLHIISHTCLIRYYTYYYTCHHRVSDTLLQTAA